MILFFWLVVIHAISIEDIESKLWFYAPKVILAVFIWIDLFTSLLYIYMMQYEDPSFYWRDDMGENFSYVRVTSSSLILIYALYLLRLIADAMVSIRDMKKSYKFVLGMTLAVVFICLTSLVLLQYLDPSNDSNFVP